MYVLHQSLVANNLLLSWFITFFHKSGNQLGTEDDSIIEIKSYSEIF